MKSNEIPIFEIKMLQDVIARHEQLAFRVIEWFSIIISGLAFLLYSKPGVIGIYGYIIISCLAFILFGMWLIYHRGIVHIAAERVEKIEFCLRSFQHESYDGPMLKISLSEDVLTWQKIHKIFKDKQVGIPLFVLLSILAIIGWLFLSNQPGNLHYPIESKLCDPNTNVPCPSLIPIDKEHTTTVDGLILINMLLICGGFALTLWGKGVVKLIGVISLFSGATFTAIKEFNVDNLNIVIERKINETEINKFVDQEIQTIIKNLHISSLVIRKLGDVKKFRPGFSTIDTNGFYYNDLQSAEKSLDIICNDIHNSHDNPNNMIIIIGAVDRLPLDSAARLRYESNLGLAQARAEAVKAYLYNKNCLKELDVVLTFASGPHNTPKVLSNAAYGFSEDRMVKLFIFENKKIL